MKKTHSPLLGFTLIELIIVVTIIIILAGSVIAGYFTFTKRQAIANDARNFVTELRKTQSLARNLVYPSGCVGLQSYTMRPSCVGTTCKSVDIVANCTSGGDANGEILVKANEEVLQSTYFTDQSYIAIKFAVGTGNISPTGTYVIYSDNAQENAYINLYDNGNIEYITDTAEPAGDIITPTATPSIGATPTITPTTTLTPTLTPTPSTPLVEITPTVSLVPIDGGFYSDVECPLGMSCANVSIETCLAMGGNLFTCSVGNCCLGVSY